MDWGTLITSIVGSLGLSSTLAWTLTTKFIEHRFGKERDMLKQLHDEVLAEKAQAHQRQMALLEAEQRFVAFRKESRFGRLHEKRAEVVAEVYKWLARMNAVAGQYVSPLLEKNDAKDKIREELGETWKKLGEAYYDNRLYLPERITKSIDAIMEGLRDVISRMDEGTHDAHVEAWKMSQAKLPGLLRQVEREMQVLLGADDGEDPAAELPELEDKGRERPQLENGRG
jgi:hypothetical protein